MLKLVSIGIWVILVTAGATFASVHLARTAGPERPVEDLGVEQMTSEMMSIPVIRGGDVSGYVILQLSFAADRALLEHRKLDPMPFMQDAAFRVVFTQPGIDFLRLKPEDLDALTDRMAKEANGRLGAALVRQVLLQQVNYVKKEDIRTNWIGTGHAGD